MQGISLYPNYNYQYNRIINRPVFQGKTPVNLPVEEVQELLIKGKSKEEICEKFGVNLNDFFKFLKNNKINIKFRRTAEVKVVKDLDERMPILYAQKASIKEMVRDTGHPKNEVLMWLRNYEGRPVRERKPPKSKIECLELLQAKTPIKTVAEKLNLSNERVRQIRKELIEEGKLPAEGLSPFEKKRNIVEDTMAGLTAVAVAKKYNISTVTVERYKKQCGVQEQLHKNRIQTIFDMARAGKTHRETAKEVNLSEEALQLVINKAGIRKELNDIKKEFFDKQAYQIYHKYQSGISVAELCSEFKLSKNTVMSRIKYAKNELQKQIPNISE